MLCYVICIIYNTVFNCTYNSGERRLGMPNVSSCKLTSMDIFFFSEGVVHAMSSIPTSGSGFEDECLCVWVWAHMTFNQSRMEGMVRKTAKNCHWTNWSLAPTLSICLPDVWLGSWGSPMNMWQNRSDYRCYCTVTVTIASYWSLRLQISFLFPDLINLFPRIPITSSAFGPVTRCGPRFRLGHQGCCWRF